MRFLPCLVALAMSAFPLSALAQSYQYEKDVSLHGVLLFAKGATPDGKKINFPALQLDQTIVVLADENSEGEKNVRLLHMVLDPANMSNFKKLKGRHVTVTGTLFHWTTGHHQTPVLIMSKQIVADQ